MTITIIWAGTCAVAERVDTRSKSVIFKNCAAFTDCISEITNTQIDNTEYIDVLIPMYNSIKYGDNYLKISRGLWQYYKDDPKII